MMIINKLDEPFDVSMLPGLEFAREVDQIIQDGLAGFAIIDHREPSLVIEVAPRKQGRFTPLVEIDVIVQCMGVSLYIGHYLVESQGNPTVDDMVAKILEGIEREIAEFVKSITNSISSWHQEVMRRRKPMDSHQQVL